MPSNFFIGLIINNKIDVSTYRKFIFQSTTRVGKYEMIQNDKDAWNDSKCFYSWQEFCISYNSVPILAQND